MENECRVQSAKQECPDKERQLSLSLQPESVKQACPKVMPGIITNINSISIPMTTMYQTPIHPPARPPWPNGQGVGPLVRRLWARVPQGVCWRVASTCPSMLVLSDGSHASPNCRPPMSTGLQPLERDQPLTSMDVRQPV